MYENLWISLFELHPIRLADESAKTSSFGFVYHIRTFSESHAVGADDIIIFEGQAIFLFLVHFEANEEMSFSDKVYLIEFFKLIY